MLWVAHRPHSYITWDAQKLSTMHAVHAGCSARAAASSTGSQAVQHFLLRLDAGQAVQHCCRSLLFLMWNRYSVHPRQSTSHRLIWRIGINICIVDLHHMTSSCLIVRITPIIKRRPSRFTEIVLIEHQLESRRQRRRCANGRRLPPNCRRSGGKQAIKRMWPRHGLTQNVRRHMLQPKGPATLVFVYLKDFMFNATGCNCVTVRLSNTGICT